MQVKQSVKDSTYETMPTDLPVPPKVTQQQQKEPIKQTPKTTLIPKVVEPGQKPAKPKEISGAKAAKTPSNKVAPATVADGAKHPSPKAAALKQSKRSKKSSKKADHKSPKPEKKPVTAEMPKVEDPAMPPSRPLIVKEKKSLQMLLLSSGSLQLKMLNSPRLCLRPNHNKLQGMLFWTKHHNRVNREKRKEASNRNKQQPFCLPNIPHMSQTVTFLELSLWHLRECHIDKMDK